MPPDPAQFTCIRCGYTGEFSEFPGVEYEQKETPDGTKYPVEKGPVCNECWNKEKDAT